MLNQSRSDLGIPNRINLTSSRSSYVPREDNDRLFRLINKHSALSKAEDEEEARLRVRIAAYWHSPKGRDHARMSELRFKSFRGTFSVEEQEELEHLELLYPKPKSSTTPAWPQELKSSSNHIPGGLGPLTRLVLGRMARQQE